MRDLGNLLQLYRQGMSFFGSEQGALLASGLPTEMPLADLQMLLAHRQGALPVLAAVPFCSDSPVQVVEPEQVCIFHRGCDVLIESGHAALQRVLANHATVQAPSPSTYQLNVQKALAQIRARVFDKVVLARSLTINTDVDLPGLLNTMAARNPLGYTFALELFGPQRRTLIGASPELLLAKRGGLIVSNPLAGSIAHCTDPKEDALRAQALLRSEKDRREHALVVDSVVAALRPYCVSLDVPEGPSLLSTPTMWHLSTEIRGELIDPYASSLDLALALHPTPAVCGYPEEAARAFIAQHEGFERGLFTGLVGWSTSGGDGEWAVTIRCAEVGDGQATLYAGAGIVAGSEPELELAETSAKLRTMLGAMGLESVLEAS